MRTNWLTALVLGASGVTLSGCGATEKADAAAVAEAERSGSASAVPCEGCAADADKPAVVAAIEAAHGKAAYDALGAAGKVVKADFDVDFGGGDLIAGTMWYDTPVGKVRMELDNGAVVVFDGQTGWSTQPDPEQGPSYRFHVLTWPYFMAAPFKLSDPGVTHADVGEMPLTAKSSLPASKMTFGEGVGDAPDDWYLVFKDPGDDALLALGYIVTFGTPKAYAEEKPSIIFYRDPVTVDGVTFATQWVFHFWNEASGMEGDAKGRATVSNIEFVVPPAGAFEKPEGAQEATLPGV